MNLEALIEAIGPTPYSVEPSLVRRRSRDYFWYSPALAEDLKDMRGDIVVMPRDEADVLRVAAACARHRIPLTPRGAGTGNYGQAVPLRGGIVLDMTQMQATQWFRPGAVRLQPGARLHVVDAEMRAGGWEWRMPRQSGRRFRSIQPK